ASPDRLAALKQGLLDATDGTRRGRGLRWQVAVAAAVLLGLVGVLFSSRSPYRLVDGRLALEDGRLLEAPQDLSAAQSWRVRAVEKASVRLADHSTITLSPEARLALDPAVAPQLISGEAEVQVAPAGSRFSMASPAGHVEMESGRFSIRIVFQE